MASEVAVVNYSRMKNMDELMKILLLAKNIQAEQQINLLLICCSA